MASYEDYLKMTQGLNADNVTEIMNNVLNGIKADLEERDAFKASVDGLNASIEEKDTKIRDLQDTNIKLFLQSAAKPTGNNFNEEAELTGEDFITNKLKSVGAI